MIQISIVDYELDKFVIQRPVGHRMLFQNYNILVQD